MSAFLGFLSGILVMLLVTAYIIAFWVMDQDDKDEN